MTRTTKIRTRDLKQPKLFYHFCICDSFGGYRHPEICIRSQDRFGEDILTFRWQINPAHDEDRFGRNTLTAYAPKAEIPMDCEVSAALKLLRAIHTAIMGNGRRLTPKTVLRTLRTAGLQRYVYADNFRWVPRRYRGNEKAFLAVQDAVATD